MRADHEWMSLRRDGVGAMGPRLPAPALLVLAVCIGVTAFLTLGMRTVVDREEARHVERVAADVRAAVQRRVDVYIEAIYGLRSLFLAQPDLSRETFAASIAANDVFRRAPGAVALSFDRVVQRANLSEWQRSMRSSASADFAVHPTSTDHDPVVVDYLEPLMGNEAVWGFDVASEDARRRALEQARDGGDPVATSPIDLVQGRGRVGVLLFLGVYDRPTPPLTEAERRRSFIGVVTAALDLREVMAEVPALNREARIRIFDVGLVTDHPTSRLASGQLLWSSGAALRLPMNEERLLDLNAADRRWRLGVSMRAGAAGLLGTLPIGVALAGILLSLLATMLARSMARGRSFAVAIAQDMTQSLRTRERELALSETMLRTTVDALHEGVVVYDIADGVPVAVLANPAAQAITGIPFDRLSPTGSQHRAMFDVDGKDLPVTSTPLMVTAGTGEAVLGMVVGLGRDPEPTVWMRVTTQPMFGADGSLDRIVASVADITDAHEVRRELEASHRKAAALLEHGSDLITTCERDGTIGYASPAHERLLGLSAADCVGTNIRDLIDLRDAELFDDAYARVAAVDGATTTLDLRLRHADGTHRWVDATLANRLHDPAVTSIVTNMRDVTERVDAAVRLEHQATHDHLTALPNRALLLGRMQTARPGGRSVLFLDIDRFKHVNDSLGHAAGDRLLARLATRLQRVIGGTGTLARIGGDEFVVLLDDLSDTYDATVLADRIRDDIAAPFSIDGRTVVVSVSIGVASGTRSSSADELLQQADTALYRAKENGRNRVEVYDHTMTTIAQRRLRNEQILRAALDQPDGLVVVYQPIIDLASRTMIGHEALLRVRGPDRTLRGPAEFIQVAEDLGLIVTVGLGVLDQTCADIASGAIASGPGRRTWVNVSPRQLSADGFVEHVQRITDHHRIPPSALGLEITETALIDAGDGTRPTLDQLRTLGISIALDDFGTGWSSLSSLRRFPFDAVKIDRGFVAGLGTDHDDTELVRAIIGLGQNLGLVTVAEGVETQRQADLLAELGCDHAQGYLFGRPAQAGALRAQERHRTFA